MTSELLVGLIGGTAAIIVCERAVARYLRRRRLAGEVSEETPASPQFPVPEGWFVFGTHVGDGPQHLEFSREYDESGMPMWERPCPGCAGCRALGWGVYEENPDTPNV